MIDVFLGTDSKKARAALHAAMGKVEGSIIRLTDTSAIEDVRAALRGGGMFAQVRIILFDRLSDNAELWHTVLDSLEQLAQTPERQFLIEEKVDAATKRLFAKYAASMQTFDAAKKGKERPSVFAMVDYLRARDKKRLWVAYQQELAQGNAAEAIHGVLFWGVKQALLAARSTQDIERGKKLIITLTELPHESRRRGEELEYALERFILTVT